MYKYLIIGLLAVMMIAPSGIALAQQTASTTATSIATTSLTATGDLITPSSPLFFAKRLFENVGTLFTFGTAAKTQRYLNLADRRLAEAQQLARQGNDKAQEAVELWQREFEKAKQKAEQSNKEDLIAKVTDATNKHIDVLENVLEKVSDQAKPIIERNIERAKERQQKLIDRIESTDSEKAGKLAADAMVNRINSVKRFAKNATPEQIKKLEGEVEKWKEYLDKLGDKNPELKAKIADRIDSVLEHLDNLKENKDVLDALPKSTRDGLENMRKNILEDHIQAIRKLGEVNAEKSAELLKRVMERGEKVGGIESLDKLEHVKDEIFNRMEENGVNSETRDRIKDNFNRIIKNRLNYSTSTPPLPIESLPPVREKIKERIENRIETRSSSTSSSPLQEFQIHLQQKKMEHRSEGY